MALNVVMLGASRSGKTSILASMLNNVRNPHADNNVNKHFFESGIIILTVAKMKNFEFAVFIKLKRQ